MLPIVLNGEEDEVLAYHPHAAERVEEIKRSYTAYLNKVVQKVKEWQSKGLTGQALAHAVFGQNTLQKWELRAMKLRGESPPKAVPGESDEFIREMIMKLHKLGSEAEIRQKVDEQLRTIALGQGTNAGNPKKLIDIIGLSDQEDDAPDLGEI